MKKTIFYSLIGALLFACNSKENKTSEALLDEAKKAIAESNIIYWKSFVKNDSSLFIARYADDACIMPPNIPAMCGSKAAPDFFNAAYNQLGVRNGKFTTTEVFPSNGEYVTENGLFELRDSVQNLIDNGKYLVLWKKTNKGWQMYRDCFSSNNPTK